ncbi:MAG TPA: YfhO family protein [Pyrinomonadaceae bacterium]|jgi:hypothetical protein
MNRGFWRGLWNERREDATFILVIIIFFILFFGDILFGDKSIIGGDSFFYTWPLRTVSWDTIRHGTLPLWTPFLMSGYPLLSISHIALGYPLTWGYLFLPEHRAELIFILAPYLLSPAFMYAYARQIGRSRTGSLLAGLSFTYGGLMCSYLASNGTVTNAMMWLPLMLIAIERARRRPTLLCLAGATGAYAMSILVGNGQFFLYVGALAILYAVMLGVSRRLPDAEGDGQARWLSWRRWAPLGVATGAIILSMGIAAFQILETLRAVRRSVRYTLDYDFFVGGSFTLSTAVSSLIAPVYHFVEVTTYVPPLVLLLAITGLALSLRPGRYDPRVLFWSAIAAIGWILMLGDNAPLYPLLFHVPLFKLFRVPARHAFEWTFAISILSAYGWDGVQSTVSGWKNSLKRPQGRMLTIGIILLAAGVTVGIFWWRAAGGITVAKVDYTDLPESSYIWWKILFTSLTTLIVWQCWRISTSRWRNGLLAVAVMLICFFEPFILVSRLWWRDAKTMPRLLNPSTTTRLLQDYPPEQNRIYSYVNLFAEQKSASPRFDAPDLTARYGLHNVAGYEQLTLERYSRALGNVWQNTVHTRPGFAPDNNLFNPGSHVLDLLNMTFLITSDEPTTPDWLLDTERWQLVYDEDNVRVLKNKRALPRVWLVAEAEAVDGVEALRRIRGEGAQSFDPRQTALLEILPKDLPALPGGLVSSKSSARIVSYENNRLVIETIADSPTVLVVSETFYPGWEATLDGKQTQILITDFLLRGVVLPAGSHRIEMRYTAPAARTGAFISISTLLLLGAIMIYARRSSRHKT